MTDNEMLAWGITINLLSAGYEIIDWSDTQGKPQALGDTVFISGTTTPVCLRYAAKKIKDVTGVAQQWGWKRIAIAATKDYIIFGGLA